MTIEEQIVEWASSRPAWQRSTLRRVAAGATFNETDVAAIADKLAGAVWDTDESLRVEDLPTANVGAKQVRLLNVCELDHVNALVKEQSLSFGPDGITVVYGDNGSGKSGYAPLSSCRR